MKANWNNKIVAGLAAVMSLGAVATAAAPAQADGLSDWFHGKNHSVQTDKNTMRNLGIGLGAAAAYELLNGKTGPGVLLGAGAAYAAKKYNDDRKEQSQRNNDWHYRYDRNQDYRHR